MDIMINRLPAPTWNWLKLNDAKAKNIEAPMRKQVAVALPAGLMENASEIDWAAIPTGCGEDMDKLAEAAGAAMQQYAVGAGVKVAEPMKLDYVYEDGAAEFSDMTLAAAKDAELVVIEDLSSACGSRGFAAVRTKLFLAEGARVTLVQVQRMSEQFTTMLDVGATLADGASLTVIQLLLGGHETYVGCRAELIGKEAGLTTDTAYNVCGDGKLDMNYIANHIGKHTTCDMQAGGVLRDRAFKLYRGTIDFKKGAKGAVGNEKEDVLLLDDHVVNQTIPLILCAEEDVEGNHGATIGQLDDELLFYLESRGLSREEIYEMMAQAKIDAVCRKIPDEETRRRVQQFTVCSHAF